MISKQRLEELIKEEKGCYILANAYTIGYIHLNKKYEPIIEPIENGYCLWVFTSNEFDFRDSIHDYNLFETKEDAEWYLEFGNITRTETLSLPRFESVVEPNKAFLLYEDNYYLAYITPTKQIVINYYKVPRIKNIFNKQLTKENYIEACKLAKKLFLGEEV